MRSSAGGSRSRPASCRSRLAPARGDRRPGRNRALAAELECSRKHLITTFRDQIGLSPKTVARVLHFPARDPAPPRRRLRQLGGCAVDTQGRICMTDRIGGLDIQYEK
jgi:AraC-like DNA-binding protein